jgi:hypothetical protein
MMVKCPRCGHENLPSFPTCSRCGTGFEGKVGMTSPLSHFSKGAPVPPADEYASLMASRTAASKRNRGVFGGIFMIALVVGGYLWYRDYRSKGGKQEKLDFFERWAELERKETGAFFNCVMSSEIDVNLISTADQVQQRIEAAYFTQQKTFSDHLLTDCVPKIERARQAFGALKDPPAELAPPMAKYQDVLPQLQSGIEEYAEKIKSRQGVKDVDQLIQELGNVWQGGGGPSPEAVAFEKFLHCAVPGLAKMKDVQQMLEFMADACFKKDPVAFMDRVRKDCGPLLSSPSGSTPSKTWKLSQQRFLEEDARQLQAWESCGKRSRKGKKTEDLTTFLTHVGTYMEARVGVVKAARAIADPGKK